MGAPAIHRYAQQASVATQHPRRPANRMLLAEPAFAAQISLERRRAERSERAVALMQVDCTALRSAGNAQQTPRAVLQILASAMRATDVVGWQVQESVAGVLLTEFGECPVPAALSAIEARLLPLLNRAGAGLLEKHLRISFRVFPSPLPTDLSRARADLTFYPELKEDETRGARRKLKRALDVLASATGLLVLAPVLGAVAAAVRLTSRGPAIYRQERIGRMGVPFVMYKFRTMRWHADPSLHRQFVERLIRGEQPADGHLYKICEDPRVTRLGRFLRRTSLDELPQLVNVLRGDMSLVGPRPPLGYEVQRYEPWHARRVLEAKPGLTGLWQVAGRSRTPFDEMVRMDLRYARQQSLGLDLALLCRTVRVLFSDDGAR